MKTLRLLIDLEYDDLAMHADDVDAKEWFINEVLRGELSLHSNLLGDEVGAITVVSIEENK